MDLVALLIYSIIFLIDLWLTSVSIQAYQTFQLAILVSSCESASIFTKIYGKFVFAYETK